MTVILTILIVIAAIAMILVVLVQKSKGGGLSSSFSSSNAIMGYKKTTDVVEKATWILATIIIVLSIATVTVTPKGVLQSQIDAPVVPEQSTPDFSSETIPPFPGTPAPVEEGTNE